LLNITRIFYSLIFTYFT